MFPVRDVHQTSTIVMLIRERMVERRTGGSGWGEAQPGQKGSLGVNWNVTSVAVVPACASFAVCMSDQSEFFPGWAPVLELAAGRK